MQSSRSGQFASGATSGPTETASLQQRAARFNQMDPRKMQVNSVLQPTTPSANGMDATAAKRITPNGMLPNVANGSSTATASKLTPDYGMKVVL